MAPVVVFNLAGWGLSLLSFLKEAPVTSTVVFAGIFVFFTNFGRSLAENLLFFILYHLTNLVITIYPIYSEVLTSLLTSLLARLPLYISLPLTELHLVEIYTLYLGIYFIRRRFPFLGH